MNNSLKTVSWVALIISIAALALAWTAYNKVGVDLEDRISQEVQDQAQATRIAAARAEARVKLVALQAKLEANEEVDQAAAEMDKIQADLNQAYANTEGEVKQEGEELQKDLDKTEEEVRGGSANALTNLANLIAKFAQDARN